MAVAYGLAVGGLIVLEALARRPGSALPTAGECLAWAMGHPAGRVLVVLAWWWAGWHFLAR
ncbi:DUF6186 family protein [Thermoactinospora rubra]|uniref:DUF6186 family protein n=1 Tax=Thermoactinospora rubra TaxID=1088767 RepID=UPI000A100B10